MGMRVEFEVQVEYMRGRDEVVLYSLVRVFRVGKVSVSMVRRTYIVTWREMLGNSV